MRHEQSPWIEALAFLAAFCLLLQWLSPTFSAGGNGGELTAACWTLGVPHPTGYPFYLHLVHLLQLLPVGDLAWRANLFSALALALMCAILARRGGTGDRRLGLISGIWLIASPKIAAIGVVSEVYALQLLLLAALLALSFSSRPSPALTGFLAGLAFTNHLLSLTALPLVLMLLWRMKRRWSIACVMFLLAFSLYLYLPLRSAQNPVIDWGKPDTWDRLREVWSGRQFAREMQPPSIPELLWRADSRIREAAGLLPWKPLWAIVALGIWSSRKRRGNAALWLWALINAAVVVWYGIPDIGVYLLTLTPLIFIWLNDGAAWCLKFAPRGKGALLLLYLFGAAAAVNYERPRCDRSAVYLPYDAGRFLLDALPPDSALLFQGDGTANAVVELREIEQHRQDVRLKDALGNFYHQGRPPTSHPADQMRWMQGLANWLREAPQPVFFSQESEVTRALGLPLTPMGWGYRGPRLDDAGKQDAIGTRIEEDAWRQLRLSGGRAWGATECELIAELLIRRANYLSAQGREKERDEALAQAHGFAAELPHLLALLASKASQLGKRGEAILLLREALKLNPYAPAALNNLAFNLFLSGQDLPEALELAERAIRLSPDQPEFQRTLAQIRAGIAAGKR